MNQIERLKDLRAMMGTMKICQGEDHEAIQAEILLIERHLPKRRRGGQVATSKRLKKTWKYHLMDKSAAGRYHWGRNCKRFFKRLSNIRVRRAVMFNHVGSGYKRVFDLAWTLD